MDIDFKHEETIEAKEATKKDSNKEPAVNQASKKEYVTEIVRAHEKEIKKSFSSASNV